MIMVILFILLCVLAAAQNNPTSGWEAKAVEFFKDKLKEKDAHTWVMFGSGILSSFEFCRDGKRCL